MSAESQTPTAEPCELRSLSASTGSACGRYAEALGDVASAVGCLQTAIELINMGDRAQAGRWIERAAAKLNRPNNEGSREG